jgi:hypothetical protein
VGVKKASLPFASHVLSQQMRHTSGMVVVSGAEDTIAAEDDGSTSCLADAPLHFSRLAKQGDDGCAEVTTARAHRSRDRDAAKVSG